MRRRLSIYARLYFFISLIGAASHAHANLKVPTCENDVQAKIQVFHTGYDKLASTFSETRAEQSFENTLHEAINIERPAFKIRAGTYLQKMDGFGAALTESCTINLMKLSAQKRRQAMDMLFSRTRGAGFDFIRLPVGASDFSDDKRPHYTYNDTPNNIPDPTFKYFSMKRDEKTFALLREAVKLNPDIRLMASPWSPPAWMKTNKNLTGGSLDPKHYRDFANYLVKTIIEYRKRGLPVDSLTIQNEPGYATPDYPGMFLSPDQQIDVTKNYVIPAIKKAKLDTRIMILDHNYSYDADVVQMLSDPELRANIHGVAYHCYEGEYKQIEEEFKQFPEVPIMLTECTPLLETEPEPTFVSWLSDYVLGPTIIGSTGSMAWNLCLDEKGGPHNGGCGTCKGLITTDFSSTEPQVVKTPEYYAFAQLSRFVRRGSQRVEVGEYLPSGIQAAAFVDDRKMAFVAFNTQDKEIEFEVQRSECQSFRHTLKPGAAATFVWDESTASQSLALSDN